MKKFNKIGKINTLYRIIAAVLVFVIALLAYPEMKEVHAEPTIAATVTVSDSEHEVTIYGDDTKSTGLKLELNDSSNVMDFNVVEGDNKWWTTTDDEIFFHSIDPGESRNYTIDVTFEGLHYSYVYVHYEYKKKTNHCSITPLYESATFAGLSGYENISCSSYISISVDGEGVTRHIDYYKDDVDFEDGATNTPLVPGNYRIELTCNSNDEYESCSASASFVISKYTPTLSIPDVTTGGEPHPTCTYAKKNGTLATVDSLPNNDISMDSPGIAYKGANDAEYSFTVPTEPGDYSATLVYSSDSRLGDFNNDVTTTFKISLKEGKGKVTVADTVYGESSVKPKAESDTNDADKAEFFYKVKNTDDSTYIKDLPTKPGKYVCKAVFPKTGNYDSCSATCEFVIEKAKGVGTLSASDVYVGMEPKASPVSATNGVTAVTYQYKEKGASDSSYTDKVPTKPGEYTVKATFAATDYYLETSATANFKTTYMPAPTFGLTGKQGKNDFYTDTVTIKAPAGYEVSLSYGKDYKDSINILDGVKYVYFKDKATGALSDKTAVPSYKMDSVLPVVKGVKNNDTIFKDEYELEITDDYLEMVKVNDQTIPVKDGKATYKLTSDSGEMLYKIEATDQAGHTVTYTITVASPWVKDGFVPTGQIVKLKPGKAYSLKGGKKYKIKGDDTVYNGGTQFYVDEERELELEEYNEN